MRSLILLLFLFSVVNALDNGLVRTPPMGWMSWTKYLCEIDCVKHPDGCINENLYATMADRLVEDGYADVGYEYVHIDDCWMSMNRAPNGELTANASRFSHGIPWLANYVHKRGLKFAIYEDYGTRTCGGYPGSLDFLETDANTFASWSVDYLKLDGCNVDLDRMKDGYPEMERYLNASGRPIVYACSWPAYLIDQQQKVNYTTIGNSCNLWRNFDDISLSWHSVSSIIDWYIKFQDKLAEGQKPGAWNDPDMIIAGNNELSDDQARAQMTIWSIWSAPLIMSNDLRKITATQKKILQNKNVIAIDQDPLGKFGKMVASTAEVQLFLKQVTPVEKATGEHSYAIAVLNRATYPVNVTISPWDLGLKNHGGYKLQDLWTGRHKGTIKGVRSKIQFDNVQPTGVAFYKATIH